MSCAASRRATNCRSRRAPRKSSNAPCRAGSDMELLSIAAILLGFLALLLGGGVWIAVALMATGWAGMQFAGGGILPGLLVMVLYSGYIAIWSLANPERTPPAEPPMSLRKRISESLNLIPCLLLIVFVFLSLLMGWATATECAAWGVLGSLAIAWWQRALTWESFWASVMGATRVNCMILLILAGASYMGTSMAYTGIPLALATWVNSFQLSPYALIAALTVMYIVLGAALDGISMIVLTTAIVI